MSRFNNGLFYTYTDHLGSVSALSDVNGTFKTGSRALFNPFGSFRLEPTTNPAITDRGFTGHYSNNTGTNDLDLIYMGSRYYLPEIGRFASADSIVPDTTNPQAYNRYSYVYNQPINFSDSTGHYADQDGAVGGGCGSRCIALIGALGSSYAAQQTLQNLKVSLTNPFGTFQSNNNSATNDSNDAIAVQESRKSIAGPASSPGGIDPGDFDPQDPNQRNTQDSNWRDHVKKEYQDDVRDAFDGEPQVIKLEEDTIVYRHYDGIKGAVETGSPWYSPKTYVNPGNAQRYLALPADNSANTVSRYVIPKGTNVLYGRVAPQTKNPFFHPHATGGGMQYYVPNPNAVQLIIP